MTDMKDDGGPAFPHDGRDNGPGNIKGRPHDGMTLRDYFAGQVIASVKGWHPADKKGRPAAVIAYEIADEMLEARK